MVIHNNVPRCGKCTNGAPALTEGYTLCHLKHLVVYSNSVACSDYDDTVIF